jgi:hypothetical protein
MLLRYLTFVAKVLIVSLSVVALYFIISYGL